jgi:hypothetical protein
MEYKSATNLPITLPTGTSPTDEMTATAIQHMGKRTLLETIAEEAHRMLHYGDHQPLPDNLGQLGDNQLLQKILLSLKRHQKKFAGVNSAAVCNNGYCAEFARPGNGQCITCSQALIAGMTPFAGAAPGTGAVYDPQM